MMNISIGKKLYFSGPLMAIGLD